MRKNILIMIAGGAGGIIVVVGVLIYIAEKFSPGSYPHAEEYDFQVPVERLIAAAEKVKYRDSAYVLPPTIPLRDGRRDSLDLWFHIYYFQSDERRILKTWIRGGPTNSKIAFVAISMGPQIGVWSEINKNFSSEENRKEKEEFERGILQQIRNELSR